MAQITQKITPFLWFDHQALEAAQFYCSIFENSRIVHTSLMLVTFELAGQKFMALNGGPKFEFTEAISLFVTCETQEEVDELWETFTRDGQESRCGWLKDRYGLSWQIIPVLLGKLMTDPDPVKVQRVMQAILGMTKIESKVLQDAYDNK